jgi:hypothetical protein
MEAVTENPPRLVLMTAERDRNLNMHTRIVQIGLVSYLWSIGLVVYSETDFSLYKILKLLSVDSVVSVGVG